MKDLMEQADSKGYMTVQEIQDNKEPLKVQQALARATNDLLIAFSLPLRREKQAMMDQLSQQLETLTDEEKYNF